MSDNADQRTVEGFGAEWTRFDQSSLSAAERRRIFDGYFGVFPWEALSPRAEGFDLGCGSGRWATLVASRVGTLHCIDASSEALAVARRNLSSFTNCEFHHASAGALPLADGSMDFGYSLGVLHHVPDTAQAIRDSVRKLKPGAPLLLYLYYAFDNRPSWFRTVWRATDLARRGISRLPWPLRYGTSQLIASTVYWPLARCAALLEHAGLDVANVPLAAYRDKSFYTMRTDALDRFGTSLEQRFTRPQIRRMMEEAGLDQIVFSESMPYWVAMGRRRASA
jgi:ubiquinone/menaquinone biosynthesis C-methylase UbiE